MVAGKPVKLILITLPKTYRCSSAWKFWIIMSVTQIVQHYSWMKFKFHSLLNQLILNFFLFKKWGQRIEVMLIKI